MVKKKTIEIIQIWALIFVLLSISAMLVFNYTKPREFICLEDGKLIEASNSYDLRELFKDCSYKCESNDYSCLELCTDMISNIVISNKLMNTTIRGLE